MPKRRPPRILRIEPGSPAGLAGLKEGDELLSINRHGIRDVLDYRFYSADDRLAVRFSRDGIAHSADLEGGVDPGIELEPMRFDKCGNRCIFCFVDQNPRGLRKTLYFKDEDYRLSFLHGNYVTFSNLGQEDLERIVEQRLSPLYVSVHAADDAVRRRMLGLKRPDGLLDKIRFLTDRGIDLHSQIVLIPGMNDGPVLDDTIRTLASFHPRMLSVAVVPVGLTRHREGLPKLEPVNRSLAAGTVKQIHKHQRHFRRRLGSRFVYAADEFYLLAGIRIPRAAAYEDYCQIENGVGMVRDFLDRFKSASKQFPKKLAFARKLAFVTGTLAAPVLERHLIPKLRIRNLEAVVVPVKNRFYGESVTVSGLLAGSDIVERCRDIPKDWTLLLPPNCLNHDGFLIDDWSVEAMSKDLGLEIRVEDPFWNILECA